MRYLTENDVHEYIRGICFKTGPPGSVGAETEWLITDPTRPEEPVALDLVSCLVDQAGPPPNGSAVSYEPGGQLELSSPPLNGPASAHAALAADIAHIRKHLDAAGLCLEGRGIDRFRPPVRRLTVPRYAAMERFFDLGGGRGGRTMMCSTASLQVCLDIGADAADAARRWRLAHRLGPLFVAAFANSAVFRGRPTGWRSTRWAMWDAIDHTRTRPARPPGSDDPAGAWAGYALDAGVMAIRRDGVPWEVAPGMSFREWLGGGHHGRPTHDDLVFHLSTLFPPVRPRGWLELRMIDALPLAWWPVPMAVAAALFDDPAASDAAEAAADRLWSGADPGRGEWAAAARDALSDPGLAAAARTCFEEASAALRRMDAGELALLVDSYRENFIERGRCPADTEPTQEVPA
ncbi:ergothioneine biosynthesis glutamate--cysteine ligase EgtA [Nocardiopsis mangrovi]|uniref:Glutamate--cysteine ligase EgtA n=1 Tax=Nocardiopsis mangrovi TaxID=1179818 RepID=A0ABV9DQ35_9ACTN